MTRWLFFFPFQRYEAPSDIFQELQEAEEPCYGRKCTANEFCCPGSVCVDVDGSKLIYLPWHPNTNSAKLKAPRKRFSNGKFFKNFFTKFRFALVKKNVGKKGLKKKRGRKIDNLLVNIEEKQKIGCKINASAKKEGGGRIWDQKRNAKNLTNLIRGNSRSKGNF